MNALITLTKRSAASVGKGGKEEEPTPETENGEGKTDLLQLDERMRIKRKTDLLQLFERLANEIKLERASRVGALFCVRVFLQISQIIFFSRGQFCECV